MKCVVGQTYLNDTLSDGSRQSYFQNVIEVDSGYICFGGKTVLYPNKLLPKLTLSFIDYDGNFSHTYISPDTIIKEFSWYGNNQFVVNNAGNFVHVFDCFGPTGRFPKLVELSPQGQLVQEANLKPFLDSLHITLVGHTVYYNASLDEYDVLINFYDDSLATWSTTINPSRTMYVRLDGSMNLIDTLLLFDPQQRFGLVLEELLYEGDEKVIVHYSNYSPAQNSAREGHILLSRIGSNGALTEQLTYNDGPFSTQMKGLKHSLDSNYLFTYEKCYWASSSEWLSQNFIVKLDKQFNLIWKTAIDPWIEHSNSFYFQQNQVIVNPDSSIIVVGGGINLDPPPPHTVEQNAAQISKYNNDGEQLWLRYIYKVPNIGVPIDELGGVVIKDVIRNSKGGYTMVGYVDYYYDGFSQLKTYAYIAETNCLGFMGDPVALAAVSYEDSLRVNFHNNSFQAGSFSWYFGDGDSLVSGENLIDFSHTYTSADSFEVLLVAHGCDVQDSLRFWVYPSHLEIEDSTEQVEFGGHFYLYPNPASGNQGLNILLHPVSDCNALQLVFYDEKGRLLRELPVQNMEQSLLIDHNFSPGTYQIVLRDEQKGLIERQTLLITN